MWRVLFICSSFNCSDFQVILASVIHLKDNKIPLDTSIIAQYIKRKSGVVLNLQDLYVSTDYSSENDSLPYCVICQDEPITKALLPCRHACVCGTCFSKIDLCPLCRSSIQSFISMNKPAAPITVEKVEPGEEDTRSKGFFGKIRSIFSS